MDRSLDTSNLRQVILDSVNQINYTYTIENFSASSAQGKAFSDIIVNGMGGSALPAELLLAGFFQLVQQDSLLPIFIHRSYGKSRRLGQNSLVLAISYSGNTEETLSSYEESVATGAFVVAIAAGGALIDKAKELGLPYIIIPNPDPMFQPRYATLYILKAILDLLVQCNILDSGVADRLSHAFSSLSPADFEEEGIRIAQLLHGKTPIIYASNEYRESAHLWKIKINENAKTPAFWNFFPELNHNEMVGFTQPQAEYQFIFLKNAVENSRNILRMEKMSQLFRDRGLSVEVLTIADYGNYLANLVAMVLVGDWTAYYLALEYGIDPTPVDMVEEFKSMMKS